MRASLSACSILVLVAVLSVAACKGDDGDSSSTTGSEPHCSAGWGDGPEVDPNYPPCGCGTDRCVGGAACAADGPGDEAWISSVCFPPCKSDADCPPLGDRATKCIFDYCRLECVSDGMCPAGYVCSEGGECQVLLK